MIGDILQPTHLLFVLVVALLVLGPKRLPEVGKSLGRGLRDFRSALSGDDRDDDRPLPSPTQHMPAHDPQPAYQPPQPAAQEPAAPAQGPHSGAATEETASTDSSAAEHVR